MYNFDFESVLLPYLPRGVGEEILRLSAARGISPTEISEIRIRSGARSLVRISRELIPLFVRVGEADIREALRAMCGGALYAHRDRIRSGYISLSCGIRVGICGRAGYEGDDFVGVSDVTSLLYRIPTARSEHGEELYSAWRGVERGMLIFSPPGLGKTTALRTLVSLIAKREGLAISVIDERSEFFTDDGAGGVDVFRGYKRAEGMEIALRVMSPEVIVVDEIGGEGEARLMLESLNSGVKIIATAHAATPEELSRRVGILPMLHANVFDVFVGLGLEGGERVIKTMEKV